jgi:hypothetical protein
MLSEFMPDLAAKYPGLPVRLEAAATAMPTITATQAGGVTLKVSVIVGMDGCITPGSQGKAQITKHCTRQRQAAFGRVRVFDRGHSQHRMCADDISTCYQLSKWPAAPCFHPQRCTGTRCALACVRAIYCVGGVHSVCVRGQARG